MNLITHSIVRYARKRIGDTRPQLPAEFARSMLAVALADHGWGCPVHLKLDGRGIAHEAKRLRAWMSDPGRGYLWLAPDRCGIVVELDGDVMRSVESDGRTVGEWLRPVSLATLGFLDPGMLVR